MTMPKIKTRNVKNALATPKDRQSPEVFDLLDTLTGKSAQLSSLLLNTHGHSQESFMSMADKFRDNYLWHCFEISEEINAISETLHTASLVDSGSSVSSDQWKISKPSNFPATDDHVDICIAGKQVTRGFYDVDSGCWRLAADGGTVENAAVTHWRPGSLPSY